jgi:hypothetical protein
LSPETPAERVLAEITAIVPHAVVIGGWATWLRTGGAKSHDIDLIVDWDELAEIGHHAEVEQSTARHAGAVKWRGTWDGVHLYLYVPHQSRLGTKLELRVERLRDHTETLDDHRVLTAPGQIAAKWAALVDRADSIRGEKDRDELLELLTHPDAATAGAMIQPILGDR